MMRFVKQFSKKNDKSTEFKPIGTITILLIYASILIATWLAVYFLMIARGGIS
ncbi:MAG: hypothetical protein RQ952_04875 [Thermoproteota archaeon]|jgi:hypothetical protein|nr:hypothetical protein [Thermoproteota archaeon]